MEYAAKEKQTSFDLGGPLGAFIKGFGVWVWVVVAVAAIRKVEKKGGRFAPLEVFEGRRAGLKEMMREL